MIVMDWKESYSINIPQIDEHHKHLFSLLNELYGKCIIRAPYPELRILFDSLIDYATYHFAEEERLMKENSFPGIEAHQKEHEKFTKRVVELDNDYHSEKDHIFLETAAFIHNWIQDHILKTDAEFGRFIAASDKSKL